MSYLQFSNTNIISIMYSNNIICISGLMSWAPPLSSSQQYGYDTLITLNPI